MITYFEEKFKNLNLGLINCPTMAYAKNIYNNDLIKISFYAIERNWIVNGKHPLVRFIKKFNFNNEHINLPILVKFNIIKESSEYIGRGIGFCNKYNQGQWFYNESYSGVSELFLIEDNFFSLSELDKWKDLNPIEVIYTDNLTFDLPFINQNIRKDNIIIYKINGVLLMLQYLKWTEDRIRFGLDIDPGYFINSFLSPKILRSYLDYTLLNIFNKLITDKNYEIEFINTLPISIHDLTKKIKSNYIYAIDKFVNKRILLSRSLSSIPLLFKDNILEIITNYPDTRRQSLWLKYFIKSHEMNIVKNILGEQGKEFNNSIFSGLNNEYKEFKNHNIVLPENTNKKIKEVFDNNITLLYDYK